MIFTPHQNMILILYFSFFNFLFPFLFFESEGMFKGSHLQDQINRPSLNVDVSVTSVLLSDHFLLLLATIFFFNIFIL